jgi:hypothetical protein
VDNARNVLKVGVNLSVPAVSEVQQLAWWTCLQLLSRLSAQRAPLVKTSLHLLIFYNHLLHPAAPLGDLGKFSVTRSRGHHCGRRGSQQHMSTSCGREAPAPRGGSWSDEASRTAGRHQPGQVKRLTITTGAAMAFLKLSLCSRSSICKQCGYLHQPQQHRIAWKSGAYQCCCCPSEDTLRCTSHQLLVQELLLLLLLILLLLLLPPSTRAATGV